jgi:hypothetical protein
MRLLLLLCVCASGCDVVLLPERIESELCGPYGEPTPVAFAAGLPALTHFSVVDDRALARETEIPFRLRALKLDGTAWTDDAERNVNLDELRANGVHYVHLGFDATLFAAQRVDGFYRVYEYAFGTVGWAIANQTPVAFETSIDLYPGGALVTGAGTPDEYRYLATTRGQTGDVAIAVEAPVVDGWRTEIAGGMLSSQAINDVHTVSSAALALGANGKPTLLYAATPRGAATGSDLYVSQRVSGLFQIGVPLALEGDNGEELEPSTNADCSVLYFRRGDQILQARAR